MSMMCGIKLHACLKYKSFSQNLTKKKKENSNSKNDDTIMKSTDNNEMNSSNNNDERITPIVTVTVMHSDGSNAGADNEFENGSVSS